MAQQSIRFSVIGLNHIHIYGQTNLLLRAPLYTQVVSNPASVYFTSTHHAVLVTVTGDLLAVTGVRPDGAHFDEFTVNKPFWIYLPLILKSASSAAVQMVPGRGPCR